jgi:hypothetical protein
MASGVEMLGQMSETEALAGPVSGGNMVVKPNEVPVGGAAMLAKALRGQANKGIGGIYELPSQKAPTPEFMQMAKAGLRQGDMLRGMGPRKGLTPYDIANMEGAVEQAGVINFLGDQPEVTVPIRSKSHADAPSTQLAYITDAEKQMLLNANMHGSLEGNQPNQGPGGIQSLDDWSTSTDDKGNKTVSGGSTANEGAGGNYSGSYGDDQGVTIDTSTQAGQDKRQEFRDRTGSDVVTEAEIAGREALGRDPADTSAPPGGIVTTNKKDEDEATKILDDAAASGDENEITKALNTVATMGVDLATLGSRVAKGTVNIFKDLGLGDVFGFGDDDKKDKDEKEKGSFLDKILSGGAFGTLMDKISKPTEESFTDDNYKAIMKNKYFNEDGTFKGDTERERNLMKDDFDRFTKEYSDLLPGDTGNPNEMRTMKDVIMSGNIPEGSDLERRLDPNEYWKNNKPVSALDFKDMAEAQAQGKLAFTKANTQAIQQGRELLAQERGGNQNNRPRFMQETQEEVVETPDGVIDEEAQTMKYTSPRTGDKEIDVPLQRRFRTDPTQDVAQYRTAPRTESDILKYMTEGTTGEGIGLEPFSEYQRRRRKAMGLDPLELYG